MNNTTPQLMNRQTFMLEDSAERLSRAGVGLLSGEISFSSAQERGDTN